MASFKASSWALLSSFREDFTVTIGSSRVMFFMLSSSAWMSLPEAGFQVPFWMMPTVRFCTSRASMSWMKLYMAG